MFRSATFKLTVWYLAILMFISVLFSVAIYGVVTHEFRDRLGGLQRIIEHSVGVNDSMTIQLPGDDFEAVRTEQMQTAADHVAMSLIYANLAILVFGGTGAYFLARRTLAPIERIHHAQSRFVSDASHELRTPLAAMQMELEVALREKRITASEAKEIFASNLEEIQKLSRLAGTLLQLSRLDQNAMDRSPLNLTKLLTRIVKAQQKHSTRITFTPPKKAIMVNANEAGIEELLTVLFDNALKYSPADTPITVTLDTHGHDSEIAITNLGHGIDPEKLPHIFDRFYRASDSRVRGQSESFGLGLNIAQQIVELHDGSLTAESALDEPTTFTVRLPLYERQK